MLTKEIVHDLVDGLINIFDGNIQQIILYGSVARNEATEDSDIDIAVILNHSFDRTVRKSFVAWVSEMDLKYDKVFSIIDIEKANMDKWGNILPFYKNIRQEGIILWKAA